MLADNELSVLQVVNTGIGGVVTVLLSLIGYLTYRTKVAQAETKEAVTTNTMAVVETKKAIVATKEAVILSTDTATKVAKWAAGHADEVKTALKTNQDEVKQELQQSRAETSDRLDVIHGLVNSAMTAEKERSLKALRGEIISVESQLELMKIISAMPGSQPMHAIPALEGRLQALKIEEANLAAEVTERTRQADIISQQVESRKSGDDVTTANTEATMANTEALGKQRDK